VFPFPLFSPAN
jgi:hypothetical protein